MKQNRLAALRKAQNQHKRQHWRMQRQDAASAGMVVNEAADGWNVIGPNGMCAGPFKTQSEAWRWLDKNTTERRYGAAVRAACSSEAFTTFSPQDLSGLTPCGDGRMPKARLGTGNKKGTKQTPRTSHTSPQMIEVRKRHAQALDYRKQGLSYAVIGELLRVRATTAHDYVIKGMRGLVPRETAQQVFEMELTRLDALLEKYQPLALNGEGDKGAAELCLKISNQRCRLAGLYPQPGGGTTVNINNSNGADAETLGIKVKFVEPDPSLWKDAPPDRYWLEGRALPLPAPPARPRYGDAPEPPEPPPAANVVPIGTARERTRAEIEGWTADSKSPSDRGAGPRGWMR